MYNDIENQLIIYLNILSYAKEVKVIIHSCR